MKRINRRGLIRALSSLKVGHVLEHGPMIFADVEIHHCDTKACLLFGYDEVKIGYWGYDSVDAKNKTVKSKVPPMLVTPHTTMADLAQYAANAVRVEWSS